MVMRVQVPGLSKLAFERDRSVDLPIRNRELLEANVPAPVTSAAGWGRALAFDDTTEEFVSWEITVPKDYIESPVLVLSFRTPSGGATSGTFAVKVQIMAHGDGDDTLADSYDTANTATLTVPGTAGQRATIAVPLTNFDGAVAGEDITVLVSRDVASDSVTGDVQIGRARLEYVGS